MYPVAREDIGKATAKRARSISQSLSPLGLMQQNECNCFGLICDRTRSRPWFMLYPVRANFCRDGGFLAQNECNCFGLICDRTRSRPWFMPYPVRANFCRDGGLLAQSCCYLVAD